jgi:hypothetical protein
MALDFNTEPYFDDYKAEKDFYRILFRPSYAVQARELTQLQTILQHQVSRFGNHVFKNGSQVIPGSVNVDNKVHFIKLEQFTGTVDVTTYIETFKNKIITGETSGVKLRVLDTTGGGTVVDDLNIPTLYCKIEGTAADTVTNRLLPGENIIAYTEDNLMSSNFRLTEDQLTDITAVVRLTGNSGETPTTYTGNSSSDVLGYGYSVDVGAGIYYIDGIFVRNDDLKLYVGRFNNVPSCRVGFKVTETTVAPEDDESILDNATGSYNFAAPGAHRYQISLSLVKLPLTGTDTFKFIELVRIVDGRVHQKVTTSSYAELEKTLARRTYDESGNYEVNKFKLSIREHNNDGTNQGVYKELPQGVLPVAGVTYGDADKFVLVVDPGKAYIQGYEVESTTSNFIDFLKAREIDGDEGDHIQRVEKQTIGLNLGNYVDVQNLYKFPDVSNFEKVYLTNTLQPKVAQVRPIVSGGVITSVVVEDGGSGYTASFDADPDLGTNAVFPNTSTGSGAKLTVNVTNGSVTSVTVVDGGADYSNTIVPTIRLTRNIPVGAAPSSSQIVGTARVRALQFSDPEDISTQIVYKLGLFDIQMFEGKSLERDVKSIVGTAASSNFSADIKPTFFALPGVATASTGSNQITGSGTLFAETLKVGDLVYLNDQKAGTVQSITGNYTITLNGNSLVNATNARITVFSTFLHEPAYETLLFPVAQSFIKTLRGFQAGADTVKTTDVIVRRLFPLYNTSNNRAQWELTSTDETFLSDEDYSNYTLINADSNLPVPFTTDDPTKVYISFDNNTVRKIVTFNNVPNGNYYLIASVQQVVLAAQEKTKVLNKINGEMIIEDKRTVNSTSIELLHGDIFKLVSIEMTPDDGSFTFDEDNVIDITHRYTLDDGQRSSYYTYGKINLKPGQPIPNGPIRVKYWFFNTSVLTDGNYFSVDSYTAGSTGITYGEIPSYFVKDPTTGKTSEISLTDVVDFRPILTTTNGFYPELPKIGSDMKCPRANYVGRIDKVVLDSFGKFNVLKGVPAFIPKESEDPKEGLVLATVAIPPYTKSAKDVIVTQRDNRRYTMNDIGKLERRISNLEYYVTLSLLEKDTAQLQIIDETTGLDRFKNGFIVDQFTGHGIGDVRNEDYKVSIDNITKTLRPMHYTTALEVVEDLSSGSDRGNKNYQKTGDLITLPYTENSYIFNNNATRTMDIHAISMGAFKGQVTLYPEGDNWKSINRRPDLTVVDDNSYDAIKFLAEELGVTGTKWDEWQTNWTSITSRTSQSETRQWVGGIQVTGYETTITDFVGYETRNGITTSLTSSVNAQSYGDRVVDMSYIPYMRSRPLTFVAQNLKAKTRFYPFFDNTSVFDYVKPADIFKVTRVSNTYMSFDLAELQNNILADDRRRTYNGIEYADLVGENGGRVEPAFGIGDVITNAVHTPTNIVSIAHLTAEANTFSFVVTDANNIKPGNHVLFYNMDYHNAVDLTQYDDYSTTTISTSNGILDNDNTSKQLNLKAFKVTAVNGGNITVANLDGSPIQPFDPYLTASYDETFRGRVYRLRASGVVAHGGIVHSSDTIGPIQQDIHVVNIKNGFALGETLTGTVAIGTTGNYNACTINEINTSTVATAAPVMNTLETNLTADADGTIVGVFYIPETNQLSFRTGERTFRLTDNLTNSNASFDSNGSAVYYAQGISLEKERTVVSSRAVEFVQASAFEDSRVLGLPPVRRTTTSTKVLYQYTYDPLAQTFTINSPGGTFLTSIDLYFSESGRRPITIELRPTDNGVPSSTKTIPMSKVTLTPSQINVSDDSSVATHFKFKSPIYLQDGETYAFVVMTDEPGAQVWVSEMGQTDILTGNTIAGQPLTGSLYASQNAKEWEIHTLLDMKFVMNHAKFNTNIISNLFLRTTPPEMVTLGIDPFTITSGQTKIRVHAKNHGLVAGQVARITGVPEGLYGANSTTVGIPHLLLNANHVVLAEGLDKDSFIINLTTTENGTGNNLLKGTTADFVTGQYGGTGISCSRGLNLDLLYFKTSDLVFPDTKIDYYVKAMNPNQTFTNFLPFVSNNNYTMPSRMNVPSYDNYPVVDNITVAPLTFKAVLSSTNENISPVIDLQQLSTYVISNVVNSPKNTLNIAEIDTRTLLKQGDITNVDLESQGTGTVSTSTVSNQVTAGTAGGTQFTTQVFPGNMLYKEVDNTLIGTVLSVEDNENLTLTSNALQNATDEPFYIRTEPSLVFENNSDGNAIIRTNIDTADNLLSSAGIGKVLLIQNVATGIDGTYTIKDVQVVEDTTLYAGNVDRDVTRIILNESFSTTATLNMITDPDFAIKIYDKFVDDTAPYGVSNYANYVTRTLSLTQPAEIIKIIMDANIVNNTEVKVYYRTWTGNVDLRKVRWVDSGYVSNNQDPEGKFIERQINITGIPSFNNVQIKIVFKSTNPVYVPKVKNLRLLALS